MYFCEVSFKKLKFRRILIYGECRLFRQCNDSQSWQCTSLLSRSHFSPAGGWSILWNNFLGSFVFNNCGACPHRTPATSFGVRLNDLQGALQGSALRRVFSYNCWSDSDEPDIWIRKHRFYLFCQRGGIVEIHFWQFPPFGRCQSVSK